MCLELYVFGLFGVICLTHVWSSMFGVYEGLDNVEMHGFVCVILVMF